MSDTVDNVMDAVSESVASGADETADVVVSEATEPVEEAPAEEVEEPEPVDEEVAEPSPSAPAPSEPVSTQEVVQNVQEILSSTETNVSGNDLENRVKVLEERLEKFFNSKLYKTKYS